MNLREELDRLTALSEKLQNEAAELGGQEYEARKKKEEIVAKIILEEKLLEESTWEIQGDGVASYLEFTGPYEGKMKDARDLTRSGWHSSFEMEEGIEIRFDDNDTSLRFESPKMILPFVQKHKLFVSAPGVMDRLAKLKREVASLEILVHQFNL